MYQNIFTPCKSFKENTEQLNINFLRMLNRYKLYISEEITKMLTLQKKIETKFTTNEQTIICT